MPAPLPSPDGVGRVLWSILWPLALAGCASYRALPLGEPPPGPSPLALRYEQTRLQLFNSTHDDARIENVFASGNSIVAVVSQPENGVFTSTDGGLDWTFTRVDDAFREVMFDGPLIIGRSTAHLRCSNDAGKSWRSWGGTPIDAAVASGGAIYAAAGGHVYVSADCSGSWKTLTPQIPGAWRARSLAVDRQSLYMSVRANREAPPLTTLLDGTSEEARSALSFVDGADAKRTGPDGIWVTHDGGALWQRTPLALDAWLTAVHGTIWAVAADPMIEGATLVRRAPVLAAALDAQLQGARPDPATLRSSVPYPGRENLVRELPAPVFRSQDEGTTWARADRAPIAVRIALERQRAAQPPLESVREAPRGPGRGGRPVGGPPASGSPPGGRFGRRGSRAGGASSRQAPQQQGQRGPRHVSTETFFALLDPVRLLARFNSGRPLAGAAGDGLVYAWAPTGPFWNSLAEAMARESDAEGEIALGGTTAPASEADGAFELLVSRDEGASWTSLPLSRFEGAGRKRSIVPYPVSIAAAPPQGIVLFAATDRDGRSWREAWRWMQ